MGTPEALGWTPSGSGDGARTSTTKMKACLHVLSRSSQSQNEKRKGVLTVPCWWWQQARSPGPCWSNCSHTRPSAQALKSAIVCNLSEEEFTGFTKCIEPQLSFSKARGVCRDAPKDLQARQSVCSSPAHNRGNSQACKWSSPVD